MDKDMFLLVQAAQEGDLLATHMPNPRNPSEMLYELSYIKAKQTIAVLSEAQLRQLEKLIKLYGGPEATIKYFDSTKPEEADEPVSYEYREIEKTLTSKIIGQDEVIGAIMKKMRRFNFRLPSDLKKPLSFFWAGPTGVGKTETAKLLAQEFGLELLRIDMSEYKHSHNVARLIGSPPGYIGFGQKGALNAVDGKRALILIDEIEKADDSIFAIFLQALDYGVITEGTGQKLDLSKCVIVMTSNIGVDELTSTTIGVQNEKTIDDRKSIVVKAMHKKFAPEFINRLSSIQVFNSLTNEEVKSIVDAKLEIIVKEVAEKYDTTVDVDDDLRQKLYEESYDPMMGVRPIHRAFENLLLEPLAERIQNESK